MKFLLNKLKAFRQFAAGLIQKLPLPHITIDREKAARRAAFLNRFSILFHMALSLLICFLIETISRRSLISAVYFVDDHTWAYAYNSFIIFASLSIVYLIRRRALARLLISAFWLFLGTINGCILASRVTPFGFTDIKCISDLLSMQNTNYFSAGLAVTIVGIVVAFLAFCIYFFFKGPKYQGKINKFLTPVLVACVFVLLPLTTQAAQNTNILASYFSNIAQGYENYGFVYGFSTSVVGRGMSKPDNYSDATVKAALNTDTVGTTETDKPNIIVVLLESFVDPTEVKYLHLSEDPIPNFRKLTQDYSTGHLTVPVVGAGTANTEFEVLTGMSMKYFGTGEYPYKTVLKQTDVESIASDLSKIGYGTHVVHNNGGNFYSRTNAFSMMGFDTFTSKEMMNIQEYTPLGDWPTDNILVGETLKSMDATPDKTDFVYTITVQGHGDYPTEKIIDNPEIQVSGAADQAANNQWEYYVNMIHGVDQFIGNLTTELSKRNEKTIVVFFGDHLPNLNLQDSDMASGSIFKTKYATWNNFGLAKQDADLTAYELLASTTDKLNIHEGTMFKYEQSHLNNNTAETDDYNKGVQLLQYDLLYGKRYAYNGVDLYPASKLVMGTDSTTLNNVTVYDTTDYAIIGGDNYTRWSKVFVNGTKVSTTFISPSRLRINKDSIKDGDTLVVNQMGSSNTVFRSSNEYTYHTSATATAPADATTPVSPVTPSADGADAAATVAPTGADATVTNDAAAGADAAAQ